MPRCERSVRGGARSSPRAVHDLRSRPAPEVWSALEYAAHSRDITALHAFGVEQALTTDEPVFPAIEGDELIQSAAATYTDAEPAAVVAALEEAAARLAGLAQMLVPRRGRGA